MALVVDLDLSIYANIVQTSMAFWQSEAGVQLLIRAYPKGLLPIRGVLTLHGHTWAGESATSEPQDILTDARFGAVQLAEAYWHLPMPEDYLTQQAMLLDLYQALRAHWVNGVEQFPETPYALGWNMPVSEDDTGGKWILTMFRDYVAASTSVGMSNFVFQLNPGMKNPMVALVLTRWFMRDTHTSVQIPQRLQGQADLENADC